MHAAHSSGENWAAEANESNKTNTPSDPHGPTQEDLLIKTEELFVL